MDHEKNIFNILEQWDAPAAGDDLTARILANLDNRQKESKKFKWAWAAMIIVIIMNLAVAMQVLSDSSESNSNIYKSYFYTIHQELVADETIQ